MGVLLKIGGEPDGSAVAVVLNRPSNVQIQLEGSTTVQRRCVLFGGDAKFELGAQKLVLWIGRGAALNELSLGDKIGDSGLRLVPSDEAVQSIVSGAVPFSDYIVLDGLVQFGKAELQKMLRDGEIHIIRNASSLWQDIWEVANANSADIDGVDVWQASTHLSDTRTRRSRNNL